MIRLEHFDFLYGLLSIPLFILLFWIYLRWKKERIKSFGEIFLVNTLISEFSFSSQGLKFILVMIAIIFLVLGMANPQVGSKLEELKRQGVDIIIALDVSNSMKAEDLKPDRLARAKQAISKFTEK